MSYIFGVSEQQRGKDKESADAEVDGGQILRTTPQDRFCRILSKGDPHAMYVCQEAFGEGMEHGYVQGARRGFQRGFEHGVDYGTNFFSYGVSCSRKMLRGSES